MGIKIICVVIGYVFGLFQTSYFIGKAHGIDIREHGSGNAGTTNMMRTLGTKAGVMTLVGDALKCIIAVTLIRLLFRESYGHMMPLLVFYTAAGVILGHNYPFYMNFRGGKGIAATAGLFLSFDPILAVLGVVTFFTVFFITHYVSLGSLCIYAGIVIEVIVLGQMGHFGMEQSLLNEMYVVAVLLAVLAYWKHRENIKRLLTGTERKTYLSSKHKSDR